MTQDEVQLVQSMIEGNLAAFKKELIKDFFSARKEAEDKPRPKVNLAKSEPVPKAKVVEKTSHSSIGTKLRSKRV